MVTVTTIAALPSDLDCLLILGVSTNPDTFRSRLDIAADLYVAGISKKVLLCGRFWGGFLFGHPEHTWQIESMEMWASLRRKGIRDQDLLIEANSYNTIGNIIFANEQFILPFRWKKIAIVTHSDHLQKVERICNDILDPNLAVHLLRTTDCFSVWRKENSGDRNAAITVRTLKDLPSHPYYT